MIANVGEFDAIFCVELETASNEILTRRRYLPPPHEFGAEYFIVAMEGYVAADHVVQ
jgi:hypothetical protein